MLLLCVPFILIALFSGPINRISLLRSKISNFFYKKNDAFLSTQGVITKKEVKKNIYQALSEKLTNENVDLAMRLYEQFRIPKELWHQIVEYQAKYEIKHVLELEIGEDGVIKQRKELKQYLNCSSDLINSLKLKHFFIHAFFYYSRQSLATFIIEIFPGIAKFGDIKLQNTREVILSMNSVGYDVKKWPLQSLFTILGKNKDNESLYTDFDLDDWKYNVESAKVLDECYNVLADSTGNLTMENESPFGKQINYVFPNIDGFSIENRVLFCQCLGLDNTTDLLLSKKIEALYKISTQYSKTDNAYIIANNYLEDEANKIWCTINSNYQLMQTTTISLHEYFFKHLTGSDTEKPRFIMPFILNKNASQRTYVGTIYGKFALFNLQQRRKKQPYDIRYKVDLIADLVKPKDDDMLLEINQAVFDNLHTLSLEYGPDDIINSKEKVLYGKTPIHGTGIFVMSQSPSTNFSNKTENFVEKPETNQYHLQQLYKCDFLPATQE